MVRTLSTYRYASLNSRGLAACVDVLVMLLLCAVVDSAITAPLYLLDVDQDSIILMSCIADGLLIGAYFPSFESSNAMTTPGKSIFGLVVSTADRKRQTFGHAAIRAVVKLFSVVSVVGVMLAFKSPRHQALHDRIAGTLVLSRK